MKAPMNASRRLGTLLILLLSILALTAYYATPSLPAQSASPGIVISQVYGGGGNSGAPFKNDFIELFNRGTTTVNLAGWSVQYASSTGTSWSMTNLPSVSLAPGKYLLIQEDGGTTGASLPTVDAPGDINLSATAGKVALVSNTTKLSGNCPTGAGIIDLVGYGGTANCFEGSAPAPAPSNTTAIVRGSGGCADTDNNSSDFTAAAPNPRNSASPANLCSNAAITTNCPANLMTAAGVATSGNASATDIDGTVTGATITNITPSNPGTIALSGFAPASNSGGMATASLNVGATTPPNNYTVTITWSNNDAPTPQTAVCVVAVTVAAITPIHTIQGSSNTSPLAGTTVTTSGIVTAVKSNGFFLQLPEAEYDTDPQTSEAIFVFTSSALPSVAAVGNRVLVTGKVQEFIPSSDPSSPPLTEITSATVLLLSSNNALPAPVTLTAVNTGPSGTLEQLERFEGMRVHVDSLTVIAPTQGSVNETNATSTSSGVFYGIITGLARPFREPGVEVPDPLPAGSPCCVPRFDANPERLRVDSNGQTGAAKIEVTTGVIVTNLTGVLDYAPRTYTILPDPPPAAPPAVTGNISAIPVPAPAANEFTVASFNMERFFDTADDPAKDDVVLTLTAFNNRLNKASLAIRNVMRLPDIIGVEEVENLSTLQAIADKVNADAIAAGQPNPNYQAFLVEGNDVGGIDVGFLVKGAPRVNVIDVTQVGKTETYINPNNNKPETLNDRPPLVLRATVQPPDGAPFAVTVIVNHLRSLLGVDDSSSEGSGTAGARVRAKRRAQAEFLANLIQARQTADPNERIISIGDYNAFQFNDGYVDTVGTIKGSPAPANQVVLSSSDLVNPDLTDLIDLALADQRYSFSFDGNAQALDHELVTQNLLLRFSRLHYARNNADFPESYRNDPNRPERLSDHDMPVAYFTFPPACAPLQITQQPSPQLACPGQSAMFSVTATGTGLSYQWRKNGSKINGATSSSFTLASVSAGDTGAYDVIVTDACSAAVTSSAAALSLSAPPQLGVYPNATATAGDNLSITPNAAPSDDGTVVSLTASTAGFTGTLSADPITGKISITNAGPAGNYTVTVRATDNCGQSAETNFTLSIVCPTIMLSPSVLPVGIKGVAYPATAVTQFGGTGSITFSVTAGALPTGLTLSPAGLISGAPTQSGIFPFTITATSTNGCASSQAYTLVIDTAQIALAGPTDCASSAGIINATAQISNPGAPPQTINFTAPLPPQLSAIPGTCMAVDAATNSPLGTCQIKNAATVTWNGTLMGGQNAAISFQAQIASSTPAGLQLCISSTVVVDPSSQTGLDAAASQTISVCATANCPTRFPGDPLPGGALLSAQKPGSVLFYNFYSSDAVNPNRENTRFNLTNTDAARIARVQLFFVNGASGVAVNASLCLRPNQTASFLASDFDPGSRGYVVAVAVDEQGCPVNFNALIGDENIRLASGHRANLTAESVAAIEGGLLKCDPQSSTFTLNFDGVSYNQLPRVLAIDSLPSPAEGTETLLIVNRVGGSLTSHIEPVGTLSGVLYGDVDQASGFTLSAPSCQFKDAVRSQIQVASGLEQVIPSGRSGWIRLWGVEDEALLGAVLNLDSAAGVFTGGHNLHQLTLTRSASLTIPIIPPACR